MRGAALFAAFLVFVAARVAYAQSILEFDGWMQRIDRKSQSVQRNLVARDGNAAAADAREIGELYKLMEDFFLRKGNADGAVKLSREGEALAAKVVTSAAGNDFAGAAQAAQAIAKACRNCHVDYKPLD